MLLRGRGVSLLSSLLLLLQHIPTCHTCLLCYLRLPTRPKSIDYLWPTILDGISLPETATEMCHTARQLPFTLNCRNGLTKIFCSLSNFLDNNGRECNLENVKYEHCMNCSREKVNVIRQTSWVLTCKFNCFCKKKKI